MPPGNGAATQYTEAIPTSGGNAVNGDGINGGHSSPSHVLGHHNAKQLEGEGQIGKETARVAAETAPSQGGTGSGSGSGSGGTHHGAAAGGGGGQSGPGGGSGTNVRDNTLAPQGSTTAGSGDGSSGLGEVIGQVTGSSSGESGLLLPLILLVALIGSLAYAWRRRRVAH
ncbi:MAG: hypothetical protein ACTHLH_03105 [Solirubrobacterales bacterium]